jgi:2-(1,2-epoxy-1,2-dihydrophenyl)acetyl-CoA isomerase
MNSLPLETSEQPGVLLAFEGPVAYITLNRPAKYNALDEAVMQLLLSYLGLIEESADVRVIVIRALGKGFCGGGDLQFFASQGADLMDTVDRMLGAANDFLLKLRRSRKLVVASVQGAAAGGGLSLVVACDFCIASSQAVFVPAYAKLAASPDFGGTANMVRAIGLRNAMRLYFMEERLSAAEAKEIGIVSKVVEPAELADATHKLALYLASLPPAFVEATKPLLEQAVHNDLATQLTAEKRSFEACIQQSEAQAASLKRLASK